MCGDRIHLVERCATEEEAGRKWDEALRQRFSLESIERLLSTSHRSTRPGADGSLVLGDDASAWGARYGEIAEEAAEALLDATPDQSSGWEEVRVEEVEEGGGLTVRLLHHPQKVVTGVQTRMLRRQSMPYGGKKRPKVGERVLCSRRSKDSLMFLDAEVIDIAPRASEGGPRATSPDLPYPRSQMYMAVADETPRSIAAKFGVSAELLVEENVEQYETMTISSKLKPYTIVMLPMLPHPINGIGEAAGRDYSALGHWDLEYLVQYQHGIDCCGSFEWLGPESVFEILETPAQV
eukprot:1893206-Rhodomonas_salina.1